MVSTGDRARAARWRAAADVLAQVRRRPGITRAELARVLRLSSGSAAEITARLRELRLLTEAPAPVHGRGRPTGVLSAHPDGPLVLVVELRHDDWRSATAGLDGRIGPVCRRGHDGDPGRVLRAIAAEIDAAQRERPGRVRATALAIAGTVRDGRLVQSASLGWGAVELAGLTSLPLLVGNDATLAGVAEARSGAAAGARAALHLTIEVGIGGALVVGGQAVGGAGGAAGEYGHLPFGDGSLRCRCGSRGCWDLEVDGRALARHLGDPPPDDPRGYAHAVLARAGRDGADRTALERVVAALGRGLAGLVHVHDPDVVTLGGLAIPLRAAGRSAFDSAYLDGLMTHRRAHPPPVLDAVHGGDGALHGAAAVALDHVTDPAGLATWAERNRGQAGSASRRARRTAQTVPSRATPTSG
ncbi:MAG TPA: ROK family transcriptional regulator [Pseudonocardia sp.]|nr:ROK family transcriptional regulator [Pseudonocardia sp.]